TCRGEVAVASSWREVAYGKAHVPPPLLHPGLEGAGPRGAPARAERVVSPRQVGSRPARVRGGRVVARQSLSPAMRPVARRAMVLLFHPQGIRVGPRCEPDEARGSRRPEAYGCPPERRARSRPDGASERPPA